MDDKEKIKLLEEEIQRLKTRLKKPPGFHKKYYEANKETVIEKANERLKKLAKEDPDKLKQYARKAYLKQKEKRQKKVAEEENKEKNNENKETNIFSNN